jgi:hypothetical protein
MEDKELREKEQIRLKAEIGYNQWVINKKYESILKKKQQKLEKQMQISERKEMM